MILILLITVEETFRCTASSSIKSIWWCCCCVFDDAVHRNVSSTVTNKIKITPSSVSIANSSKSFCSIHAQNSRNESAASLADGRLMRHRHGDFARFEKKSLIQLLPKREASFFDSSKLLLIRSYKIKKLNMTVVEGDLQRALLTRLTINPTEADMNAIRGLIELFFSFSDRPSSLDFRVLLWK